MIRLEMMRSIHWSIGAAHSSSVKPVFGPCSDNFWRWRTWKMSSTRYCHAKMNVCLSRKCPRGGVGIPRRAKYSGWDGTFFTCQGVSTARVPHSIRIARARRETNEGEVSSGLPEWSLSSRGLTSRRCTAWTAETPNTDMTRDRVGVVLAIGCAARIVVHNKHGIARYLNKDFLGVVARRVAGTR